MSLERQIHHLGLAITNVSVLLQFSNHIVTTHCPINCGWAEFGSALTLQLHSVSSHLNKQSSGISRFLPEVLLPVGANHVAYLLAS